VLNPRTRKELRLMAKINKPKLDYSCWHRGTLEYVKLFRVANPLPGIPLEGIEEPLVQQLSQGTVPLMTWVDPNFCSAPLWRIVLWVGVEVDGENYVAVLSIRNAEALVEQHVLIEHPRENRSMFSFGLHKGLELTYDRERDIFLAVPLEGVADVFASMPSVKTYFH
jgi:hypothetical protein